MKVLPKSILGMFWMAATVSCFVLIAVCGRELSDTMNIFQIMLIRGSVAFLVLLIIIFGFGIKIPRTTHLKLHIFRNCVHYASQSAWFLGVSLLPIATVFAIEFTTPIWVALIAVVALNEKFNRGRAIALIFGFCGVLIILRPGLDTFDVATIAVLGAALGFAVVYVVTKVLSGYDSPVTVLFYMNLVHIIIGLYPGLSVWVQPDWNDLHWIILVGVSALGAHYCLTRALVYADTIVIMPIDFLRLPLAIIIGILFYNEAFDYAVVLGAIMIFGGNYYNLRVESSLAQDPQSKQ